MRHAEAHERLPLFVAHELDESERAEVEAHTRVCSECREWLKTYSWLSSSLADRSTSAEHPASLLLARMAAEPAAIEEVELRRLDEHLEGCPDCRRELRVAQNALTAAGHGTADGRSRVLAPMLRSRLAARVALAAALVVAIVGAAITFRPLSANDEVTFSHQTIRGTETLEAPRSLVATHLAVEDGSQVVLRASEVVALGDGFSVGSGGVLTVETGQTHDSQLP